MHVLSRLLSLARARAFSFSVPLYVIKCAECSILSSALLGLTDFSDVDLLGVLGGTNPSILERERAQAHQIGEPEQTDVDLRGVSEMESIGFPQNHRILDGVERNPDEGSVRACPPRFVMNPAP
jgi:hypothetical protein